MATRKPTPTGPTEYASITDVAARVGLSAATVQSYYGRGKRSQLWWPEPGGDMPRPDVMIGRTPGWLDDTIDAWNRDRSRR